MKTQRRRRREKKTDYKNRINILKSGMLRVVFRKTNQYIIGQVIGSKEAKDKVLVSINSKELLNLGWQWKGSLKSIPAAYLSGRMLAARIKDVKKAILDLGLLRDIKKSRIYAFAKGVQDGGISLNIDKKYYPAEDRIYGMHMKKDVKSKMEEILDKIEHGRKE